MADKKNEQKNEQKNDQKGKNPIKLIIIIVVILAVLGGGVYVGYTMVFGKKDAAKNAQTNNNVATQPTMAQTPNGQIAITGNNQFVVLSKYNYDLGEFLVNLADPDGKRYLKAKISLGYDNKKMPKELDEKKVMIRDAVISVLRSKKAADFTEKGTDDLKAEILRRINPLLSSGQCNNVYFQDILVQ